MSEEIKLRWQSNLNALVEETLINCDFLTKPWQITMLKMQEVAEAAIRVNDPELNLLMCELALYSVGDPYHEDYDAEVIRRLREELKDIKK